MTVNTRDFGEVTIAENEIYTFPNGIVAFEDFHRFILLSPLGEDIYPMWLQSVDNPEICFIVFNPKDFADDYSVELEDADSDLLLFEENDTIDYLVIAVVPQDYQETTVNLKSPILVNSAKNIAVQVVAYENYPLRHPVFIKEESDNAGSN